MRRLLIFFLLRLRLASRGAASQAVSYTHLTLTVDQDFTADKDALIKEVGAYNGTEGQGFAQGANANSNQVEDTTAYTPDESEYNDLNTDLSLIHI